MSVFAIALVLCSDFMHAGWNLLARQQRAEAAFMARMLMAVALVGFVPAVWSEFAARSLPPKAWGCLLGSGVSCGLYYFFLARAYSASDFTIVYPLTRALPLLMVGVGDVLRGRYLTPFGWLALSFVVLGCLLTPLRSFRDLAISKYVNRGNLWVVLAALGTVGYTMMDKMAAELVKKGPATAARYGYFFFLISYIAYWILFRSVTSNKTAAKELGSWPPLVAACLNFGCYWLVLWAFQLTERASYVVAFRQFSVVIGVLLAFAIYREQGKAIRLTGTVLITAGLVLIMLSG